MDRCVVARGFGLCIIKMIKTRFVYVNTTTRASTTRLGQHAMETRYNTNTRAQK